MNTNISLVLMKKDSNIVSNVYRPLTRVFQFHYFPGVLDINIWKQRSVKRQPSKLISGQNFNRKQIEIIL